MKTKNFLNRILDAIYPKHIKCIFCGDELKSKNEYDTCLDCLKNLPRITEHYCLKCGSQQKEDFTGVCMSCKKTNFSFEFARSIFRYADNVKKVILKLKFGAGKYLIEPLSNFMCDYLKTLNLDYTCITFVPMHEKGLKKRKYNQAEELAKRIGKKLKKPVVNAFVKIKSTKNQAQLSSAERKKNLIDAFKLNLRDCSNKSYLIVDDVFTTGSTTNELAKILKTHHAKNVYILTLAHSCLTSQI